MPIKKATDKPNDTHKWSEAIADADAKAQKLELCARKLRAAIRIMKRQMDDQVPWPDTHG